MINFDLVQRKYEEKMDDARQRRRLLEEAAEDAIKAHYDKIIDIFKAEELIKDAFYNNFFKFDRTKMPNVVNIHNGDYYIYLFCEGISVRYCDEYEDYTAVRVTLKNNSLEFTSGTDVHDNYMAALKALAMNIDKMYEIAKKRLCCVFDIDESEIEQEETND